MIPVHERGDQEPSPARPPVAPTLNAAAFAVSAVAAVAASASWVLTFTPWARVLPSSYSMLYFVLAFPLFGWSVFQLRHRYGRQPSAALREFSPAARVLIGAVGVAAAVSFATAGPGLPGQPSYDPNTGRYFYDNHGAHIPTTRAAYVHALALQNRLFLGVTLVFIALAAAVTYGEWKRARELGLRAPSSRKLPAGALLLLLAAVLGLAGTLAVGALIIGRVDAYNGNATYLTAGRPARLELAPDDYVVFVGCTEDLTCPALAPAALSVQVSGGTVTAVPDPSSDRLSEAEPFVGRLSFTIRTPEAVRLTLITDVHQPVFVVPSPGEEARSLIGWIVLAATSAIVLLAALVAFAALLFRRSRRAS